MVKETAGKEAHTVNTYVFDSCHRKAKGFAGMRGIEVPEAYELLVTEGLKALGYDPDKFR